MLNEIQKETAEAIVNIFETRKGAWRLWKRNIAPRRFGSSHLRQVTNHAGERQFISADKGTRPDLRRAICRSNERYLSRLAAADLSLDQDSGFKDLLCHAGLGSEVMRQAQDDFFDRVYWNPALLSASNLGIASARDLVLCMTARFTAVGA